MCAPNNAALRIDLLCVSSPNKFSLTNVTFGLKVCPPVCASLLVNLYLVISHFCWFEKHTVQIHVTVDYDIYYRGGINMIA